MHPAEGTSHNVCTVDKWRQSWKQFRQRCVRGSVGLVYRVELQRRQTPHVHLCAWVPDWMNLGDSFFVEGWLECIGESQDADSRRYAVHMKSVEDEGWSCYLALHHSKDKRAQLGWLGKQWGVVGRSLFVKRDAVEFELWWSERARLQRLVRRLLKSRGARRTGLPTHGRWLRVLDGATSERMVRWVLSTRFDSVPY